MMSREFICLFWLRCESYACGGLLNVLYSLMPICLLSCYGLFIWIDSYFTSLGMVMDIIAQIHAYIPYEAP
jgi:hypothetical protein